MKTLLLSFLVTCTVYNAVPEQTDDTPNITASGLNLTEPRDFNIVAVSRDLRSAFPYGSWVEICCAGCQIEGAYRVEDTMAKRWRNRVDILVPDSIRLGKWENVTINGVSDLDLAIWNN